MVATDFGEAPPWNETLGPVRPRGGPNGLVLRGGRIVAEWGDTAQVDLTFSVAKSYLSILAGLAVDRGLIRDVHEPVCRTPISIGPDGGFAPPHNDKITWHHLLTADLGMGRRAVGQAGPDRPPPQRRRPSRDRQKGHAPRPAGAGQFLGIQRRAGQPPRAGAAAAVAPAVAGGVPRAGDGPDRRLADMGMARLPQLLCRDRRKADAVGVGRLALGRRRVHPCPGPGADRPVAAARRRLERAAHPVRRTGLPGCAFPARFIRNTAICGGSTPAGRCFRARRKRAIPPRAPAAT